MKILVIAPLPKNFATATLNGNQLPVKVLVNELRKSHEVNIIDLSKNNIGSKLYIKRFFDIFNILVEIYRQQRNYDLIYLTVAESFLGNVRDLFIYHFCRMNLSKIIIHMLGGAEMKNILSPNNGWIFKINKYFVSKIRAVIVEGNTQAQSFSNVISSSRIHIIPNFAEDFLFSDKNQIESKFGNIVPLKILFLSNMLFGKGHNELVEAYSMLDVEIKNKITIDFAGAFETENEKFHFLKKLENFPNLHYHGSVAGKNKKDLFHKAHIFCLPTYYPYEGQPFSIIEAMAGGCVVVTTNHSGIRNIFKDGINGFEVEKKSTMALKKKIEQMLINRNILKDIGIFNYKYSIEFYSQKLFLTTVLNLFNTKLNA